MGLAGLLLEQPAALGRGQELVIDLAVVEGPGGDQVVEVAGRLPQLAVALAHRSGGDPGQLLGQGRPRVAFTRAVAGSRELNRARRPLELSRRQPLEEHRGNRAGGGVAIPARASERRSLRMSCFMWLSSGRGVSHESEAKSSEERTKPRTRSSRPLSSVILRISSWKSSN